MATEDRDILNEIAGTHPTCLGLQAGETMTSMGSPQDFPLRSMDSLDASDRRRLDEAYADFRGAIDAYFEAEAKSEHISPDEHLSAVDAAEIVLWSLREKLLDWDRPAHLPPASSVIDWYSPEDAVYDDYEPSAQAS